MIRGNRIHNPLLKSPPQGFLVPAASERRAADIFGPLETGKMVLFLCQEQVLRTCLAVDPHSLFLCFLYLLKRLSGAGVDYVNRNREKPCHVNHPGHGLMFHLIGPGHRMEGYIRRMPGCQFLPAHIQDIAVFAVYHQKDTVFLHQ